MVKKNARLLEPLSEETWQRSNDPGVYLSLQPREHEFTEKLPSGLLEAVQEGLGTDYQLDGLTVAYDELGVHLNVSVVGKTPAPEDLATVVRTVASDHYDQPVRVRLLTRIAIDANPVEWRLKQGESK